MILLAPTKVVDVDGLREGFALSSRTLIGWSAAFFRLLPNLIIGVVVVALFVAVAWVIRRVLARSLARTARADLGQMLGGLLFWLVVGVGVLIALTTILPSLTPADLVGGLGVSTIAIGFAFKDILQNWMAGVLILLRQPFRRGDQIRINEHEGTVQQITARAVYLKTYDNRRIIIPNAEVYASVVMVNTAYGLRRMSLDLTVGYDYDFRRLAQIIQRELEDIEEVLQEPAPQVLAWELGSTSLAIKIRWWIEPQQATEVSSRARVVQAIKEAFAVNDIDPTDPQLVYYREAAPPGTKPGVVAGLVRPEPGEPKRPPMQPPFVCAPSDPERSAPRDDLLDA